MKNNQIKWKGNDTSLMECLNSYGCVYKCTDDGFSGYIAYSVNINDNTNWFSPFSIDKSEIDDYFEDEGVEIAKICGVTPDEMDYEWKMDALLSYYGAVEFLPSVFKRLSTDDVFNIVKDDWFGNID